MKALEIVTKSMGRKNSFLFLISFFFFLLGIILGFLFNIEKSTEESEKVYIPDSVIELFINNISATGSIALGFFSFGIISLALLMSNGMFIGLTVSEALSNNMTLSEVFIKIVPHGIFEIPAILISGVIGFKSLELLICTLLSQNNFFKECMRTIKEVILLSLIVICLLFFASVIEIYITP